MSEFNKQSKDIQQLSNYLYTQQNQKPNATYNTNLQHVESQKFINGQLNIIPQNQQFIHRKTKSRIDQQSYKMLNQNGYSNEADILQNKMIVDKLNKQRQESQLMLQLSNDSQGIQYDGKNKNSENYIYYHNSIQQNNQQQGKNLANNINKILKNQ